MARVYVIQIGSYCYQHCLINGTDERLLCDALSVHNDRYLLELMKPLTKKIKPPIEDVLAWIRGEVTLLLKGNNRYEHVLTTMQKKGFSLKLLAEAIAKEIGYDYRAVGRAIKLVFLVSVFSAMSVSK